ncbi:MAG: hypothetical protein HYW25_05355, partial [Candidatus Aenigmarchaeota archaeon]|nr:hypothetical protein [Candidatus Aenigmarchaeota archaeon]
MKLASDGRKFGLGISAFIVIALMISAISAVAVAQSPGLPHLFWGDADIGGVDTPAGTGIIAKEGTTERGRIITTEAGGYGGPASSDNKLLVQNAADGAEIKFYINQIAAVTEESVLFDSGEVTNLDLTWGAFPSSIALTSPNADGSILDEPILCWPGLTITIATLPGFIISIPCSAAGAGTINELSSLGAGFYAGAPVPGGLIAVGGPFEISISGFTIIVTMSYDDTIPGIDESTVAPYRFIGGVWTALPVISRDTAANTITFSVSPATPYAAFASPPAPAPTVQAAPPPGGAAPSFSLSVPGSITVQAGTSGSLNVVVTSSDASAPNTIVTASGPPASWVSISPASANIALGGSQTFVITITVPAGEAARTIPMTIIATSGTAETASTAADL